MGWLNLPIVEGAFAVGSIIGMIGGFFAGYGVESWRGYNRGFKAGYTRGLRERDAE